MNEEYGQITNVSTDFYIKQFLHKQVYKICLCTLCGSLLVLCMYAIKYSFLIITTFCFYPMLKDTIFLSDKSILDNYTASVLVR